MTSRRPSRYPETNATSDFTVMPMANAATPSPITAKVSSTGRDATHG